MRDAGRENRDLWNAWSDAFQALWNADTADGELPPAPYPLSDGDADGPSAVEGGEFVELGCGGGQATVGAAQEGAATAVGVDLSAEQLRHALRLRGLYGVDCEFVAGDVTDLPFADGSFDVAFSGWVFQMVEGVETALAEARRVLREEGLLVFDVPHPFYELFDPETRELARSYHGSERRRFSIDDEFEAEMVVFDRTVGDLHNAVVDAGFVVERVTEEPEMDDPEAYDDDPLESNRPELMAMVPRSLRFRATPA